MNSRYYNPTWGRFINTDNLLNTNRDLISNNLFVYVNNNPVNYFDSNGNFGIKNINNFFTKLVFGAEKIIANVVCTIVGAEYSSSWSTTGESFSVGGIFTKISSGVSNSHGSSFGDSSKPISGYVNYQNGNLLESSVGIKLNIFDFSFKLNIGASDISLNVGHYNKNKNTFKNIGAGISMTDFSMFGIVEKDSTIGSDTFTNYGKVDVNLMIPIFAAAYCLVPGSQPIIGALLFA